MSGNNNEAPYSLTHMQNMGFDQELQMPMVEILNFNSETESLQRQEPISTESTQQSLKSLIETLNSYQNVMSKIAGAIGVAYDMRSTLLSGTLTTCTTVTNLNQLASITALVPLANWQNVAAVESNINNVSTV